MHENTHTNTNTNTYTNTHLPHYTLHENCTRSTRLTWFGRGFWGKRNIKKTSKINFPVKKFDLHSIPPLPRTLTLGTSRALLHTITTSLLHLASSRRPQPAPPESIGVDDQRISSLDTRYNNG